MKCCNRGPTPGVARGRRKGSDPRGSGPTIKSAAERLLTGLARMMTNVLLDKGRKCQLYFITIDSNEVAAFIAFSRIYDGAPVSRGVGGCHALEND